MNKSIATIVTVTIISILAVILLAGAGFVAYSFLRTPEAASEPIEAIPVAVETGEAVDPAPSASPTPESTTPPPEPAPTETEGESPAGPTTEPTAEESVSAEQSSPESNPAPVIFEISQAESEARFLIDEVLRGDPVTVVGTTDQVAGQFAVDPNDLSTVEVGPVQINARTLATDNNFRNRAIKNRILLTDNHEFVTFTPTEIVGLPERGTVGESYTFEIRGDLTVTDVTRPVTFEVTATASSPTRLEGVATTRVLYRDFELAIPEVPAVDTVDDEVRLELAFVAEAL